MSSTVHGTLRLVYDVQTYDFVERKHHIANAHSPHRTVETQRSCTGYT
jgi:hypothetical protein